MKTPALFLALSLCFVSLAHADSKTDRQKLVDEQTTIINSNTTENYVLAALVTRADAYLSLNEYSKASADADKALGMLDRHRDMIDYLPAKFSIWKIKGEVAFEAKDYDTARQAFTEAAGVTGWEKFFDAVEFLLYRCQTHLYQHSLVEARIEAEQALKLCDAEETGQLATSHRLLAVVRFEMGDLEGAISHWNEAKKNATYLENAPFAPEQIPFNRAAYENRDTSRAAESVLARANYFVNAAQELKKKREKEGKVYFVGDNSPPPIYGLGGYSNLVNTKKASATPTTLVDDALIELKFNYNFVPADFLAVRAKARAFRWRIDDWDTSRKLDFKLSEVDDDYNRAVELKPFDSEVRRGRADWLESRFTNLARDAAGGPPLTPEQETKTRLALSDVIIEDISRVLLKSPDDTALRSRRIMLEAKRPSPDLNALMVDYDILVPLLKGAEQTRASAVREKVQAGLVAFTPKTGTALGWKTKGNVLAENKDYQGASDAFTKALLLDPKFADALHNRANAYLSLNRLDLAMRDEDSAIAIEPRHKAAYIGRSTIKLSIGDFDGAVANARKSIEVAPDEIWRKHSRDNLAAKLIARAQSRADSDTPEALLTTWTDYHEINTLAPSFESLYAEGRAATYLRRGTDALAALNKALAIKANDADALLLKTIVLTAQNSPQATATEKLMMAFINRVSDPYSLRYRVVLEFSKGDAFNPSDAGEKARLTALQDRIWTAWRNS